MLTESIASYERIAILRGFIWSFGTAIGSKALALNIDFALDKLCLKILHE